jgi:hypothetical protein
MAWRWATSAQALTLRPCRLLGLVVTPSAVNAEVTVYDGENTLSPPVLGIFLATKDSKEFNFPQPLELSRGLFVGSFTSISGVLVIWET